jgi:hypothetical protein
MFSEIQMLLFSTLLFIAALAAAFGSIAFSVARAMPRIDAVIASRGAPVNRVIRVGAPRSHLRLA